MTGAWRGWPWWGLGYHLRSLSLVLLLLGYGCRDTDECVELRRILKGSERTLRLARERASQAERTAKNLAELRMRVEAQLAEEGLDADRSSIIQTLKKRARRIRGARFRQVKRVVITDPQRPTTGRKEEEIFQLSFSASNSLHAWHVSGQLARKPPLTRILELRAPKKRRGRWELELGLIELQRFPQIEVPALELPRRRAVDDVPQQFGICGGKALRERIHAVENELVYYRDKAKETSINLPRYASWKGFSRQIERVVQIEKEARRLAHILVKAASEGKHKLLSLSIHPEIVRVDIQGSSRDRRKLQSRLTDKDLRLVRPTKTISRGRFRLALGNTIAAALRRRTRSLELR